MYKKETIENFYKRKGLGVPNTLHSDIGHFNLFPLKPIEKGKTRPIPYSRRDYYKVMLILGNIDFHYADRIISTNKQALVFSNPAIPYKCEHLERINGGQYCIFDKSFFHQYVGLDKYQVFQPNGMHVFELSDKEVETVVRVYQKMQEEFNGNYLHKYDVLRNLVLELLHFAMRKQPNLQYEKQPINASQRITTLFYELLERQFPIEENHPRVSLRSASDFATHLNIHVNHLNKAVKEIKNQTTSQIIATRILNEAKILLKHSNWNISEIAYALGFMEATHFNNFFKKHMLITPSKFRKS